MLKLKKLFFSYLKPPTVNKYARGFLIFRIGFCDEFIILYSGGLLLLLLCVNENNDRCKKGKKQLTNWNGYSIIPFVRRKHQSGQHNMREWLRGGASPCQGEGRGFESRLALFLFALKSSIYAGFGVLLCLKKVCDYCVTCFLCS